MKIPEISGVHRPPEVKWHDEGTIVDWGVVARGERYGVIFLVISRFTILSRFFVMLVFLFCKLFEHYRQTNFLIIKTKPFKVTKYKKVWRIFRTKWVKFQVSSFICHIHDYTEIV